MAVVKASYTKASAGGAKGAKQGVRYATHREDGSGERTTRELYDRAGSLSRQDAYRRIDQAEADGGKYHYRLILNNGEGQRAADLQQTTRDTMQTLSDRHGGRMEWVAVNHEDHSRHGHTHVIAVTEKTLSKADLAAMRAELGRSHERHTRRDGLEQHHASQQREEPGRERPAPAREAVRDESRPRFEAQRARVDQLVSDYRKERHAQVVQERNRTAGAIKSDADFRRWSEGTQRALGNVNTTMQRLSDDLHRTVNQEERRAQGRPEEASTARSDAQLQQVQDIRERLNTQRANAGEMMDEYRRETRAEVSERRADDAGRMRTPEGTRWLNDQLNRELRQVDRETESHRAIRMDMLERDERQALWEAVEVRERSPRNQGQERELSVRRGGHDRER